MILQRFTMLYKAINEIKIYTGIQDSIEAILYAMEALDREDSYAQTLLEKLLIYELDKAIGYAPDWMGG